MTLVWQTVFVLGLLWLGYVFFGYPLLLVLLGKLRRIRPAAVQGEYLPSVSVLIAARNEEKDIEWKIRQTLAWDYPPDRLQVLVGSDASTDRTDAILSTIQDSRQVTVRLPERGGKVRVLNQLAALASGEILFFTDANSHIEAGVLRQMVKHFADARVGCVTGLQRTRPSAQASGIESGEHAYMGYEGLVQSLESRLGSVLICHGSIYALRRSLFGELDPELANDLEHPLAIASAGHWVLHESSAFALEFATTSAGEEFRRRSRICGQGMLGMLRLGRYLSGIRRFQFVSRKLLRWLVIVPLTMVFVAAAALAASPFFRAIWMLEAGFLLLALLGGLIAVAGRKAPRPASVPFYVLLVAVAGFVGVLQACLGRRFAVWDGASLSRGTQTKAVGSDGVAA